MRYGTVVRFFPDKGFGFIQPDQGPDIFFHVSAIGACDPNIQIDPGQAVKYELMSAAELRAEDQAKSGDREPSKSDRPTNSKAKLVELIDKIPGASLEDLEPEKPAARHPRARHKKPTWKK